MNQEKIGKFISDCRKKKNMTQAELAEKFNITDRAVSKWERGLSLPDASIMLELCNYLDITVNELLSGEMIMDKEYKNKAEEVMISLTQEKENADKNLLVLEIVIGFISSICFMTFIFVSSYIDMDNMIRIILIILGIIIFSIGMYFAIKIEQIAGYYECKKCHFKYVPKYKDVLFSMHVCRTRYMKCPNCGKKSWNKKVISK